MIVIQLECLAVDAILPDIILTSTDGMHTSPIKSNIMLKIDPCQQPRMSILELSHDRKMKTDLADLVLMCSMDDFGSSVMRRCSGAERYQRTDWQKQESMK